MNAEMFFIAVLSICLSACRSGDATLRVIKPPVLEAQAPRARIFAKIDIDTLTRLHERGINNPQRVFVVKGGFILQDGVTSLVGLSRKGELSWQNDLAKEGVSRVSDIQRGQGDSIFVLDSPAKRVWVVTSSGKAVDTILTLRVGSTDTFVALPAGQFIAITVDSAAPLVQFDRTGAISRRLAFPWEAFQKTRALARQGYAASMGHDSTWAFATAFSDGFVVFDGVIPHVIGRMLEPVGFPDVILTTRGLSYSEKLGRVTLTAEGVALDQRHLLVLYAGTDTSVSGRVVDRYSLKDGTYSDSFRLPARARGIATDDEHVYVLTARELLSISIVK
jgi:hypothetical protein